MNYIEFNPKLFEYCLIEDGKLKTQVYQLTLREAKSKNYAFALNRANKRYVLKTEIKSDVEKTIIVLPQGN
tara:strand:- start:2037 stop:2249 length:213 start_codon:yes stop_codon:yes gene_type:complete